MPTPQVDVPTPELGGESITEGTIAEWNAKVGRVFFLGEISRGDVTWLD